MTAIDPKAVVQAQMVHTADLMNRPYYLDSDDGTDYLLAALRLTTLLVEAYQSGGGVGVHDELVELTKDDREMETGCAHYPRHSDAERRRVHVPPLGCEQMYLTVLEGNYASDGVVDLVYDAVEAIRREKVAVQ